MTQNNSDPTARMPQGQLLHIRVANEADRGLTYDARWMRQLDEQQKYVVAESVDRILRTISPRYAENVAKVDEAAKLGFAIQSKPPMHKMVVSLLRLRSWKDADDDDAAPQD